MDPSQAAKHRLTVIQASQQPPFAAQPLPAYMAQLGNDYRDVHGDHHDNQRPANLRQEELNSSASWTAGCWLAEDINFIVLARA